MCDLYVRMQPYKIRGSGGHAPPRKFLEIRRSEIASEAILGQKQSRSSYMARGVEEIINFRTPAIIGRSYTVQVSSLCVVRFSRYDCS